MTVQPLVPDPPPAPPAPPAGTTSLAPGTVVIDPPPPPPPAPPPDDRLEVLERTVASMSGRASTTDAENRDLRSRIELAMQREQEQEEANRRLLAEKRQLEQQMEADRLGREFTSDVLDPDQFREIVRGMTPHFAKEREARDAVLQAVNAVNQRLDKIERGGAEHVEKIRKEVTERFLLRDEPDFKQLLDRKDFVEFLHERIPGARRTRMQEVQDAYKDGDTAYMATVAKEFREKRAIAPPAPGITQPPGRTVADQTPRAPMPEKPVTEDDLAVAYGQMLRNEITPDQYRAVRKRQRTQEAQAAGR